MSAAPDSFAAHEAFAEVVRLYVRAGHGHESALAAARKVLEGFVSGYGVALGPLSPPAAAPLALSTVDAANELAREMGGMGTPMEVIRALESRGLRLARAGDGGPVVDAGGAYQVPVEDCEPVIDEVVPRVKFTGVLGASFELLTTSEASWAVKDAGWSGSDARRLVERLNSKGYLLVRKEG